MIVGFAHLNLSVNDIVSWYDEREIPEGDIRFVALDIDNNSEKSSFLNKYEKKHSISIYRDRKTELNIELVDHGVIHPRSEGNYSLCGEPKKIIVRTSSISEEQPFWASIMGFKETSENQVGLISPIPNWEVNIEFVVKESGCKTYLDSVGHTCMAFYCRNIARFKDKLDALNIATTSIFSQVVNGQELKIVMFRTPTGALIELIEV